MQDHNEGYQFLNEKTGKTQPQKQKKKTYAYDFPQIIFDFE